MSIYDERPWLARYSSGQPSDIEVEFDHPLAMFAASLSKAPERDLIRYFDSSLTIAEVDRLSDAVAVGLIANGFKRGDRLAVYLQNVPQFVLVMLATWKAGGIMVSINPMNKAKELKVLLDDSEASALVCSPDLYEGVAAEVVPTTRVRQVLTTSELDFLTEPEHPAALPCVPPVIPAAPAGGPCR